MYLKYVIGVIHLLVLHSSVSSRLRDRDVWLNHIRVKRQDGYVYNRPNVSFDLPTRTTPGGVTQTFVTPAVQSTPGADRTQSQYMYYAYPVPSGGGDTVNIGYSTGTTASDAGGVISTGGGYNYSTQSPGVGSTTQTTIGSTQTQSYNSVIPTGVTASTGPQGYNYETQSSRVPSQALTGIGPTGYNYNSPVTTVGSTRAPTATTGAPKYLPPTGGDGGAGISVGPSGSGSDGTAGVTVNIPSAPTGSGTTPANPSTPDAVYLPPSPTPSTTLQTFPSSTSPLASPVPRPPADLLSGYLPPSVPVSKSPGSPPQNTISTPASTYLPPVF